MQDTDKALLRHLRHEAVAAYAATLAERAGELVQRLLTEPDAGEVRRLQGAIAELRRFADYPAELERRAQLLDALAEEPVEP